jgi:hypothetical protein
VLCVACCVLHAACCLLRAVCYVLCCALYVIIYWLLYLLLFYDARIENEKKKSQQLRMVNPVICKPIRITNDIPPNIFLRSYRKIFKHILCLHEYITFRKIGQKNANVRKLEIFN